MQEECVLCGEGFLIEKVGHNEVSNLEFHYSTCSSCGSDQASSEQVSRNKQIAINKAIAG